jgi:hypothetical protein
MKLTAVNFAFLTTQTPKVIRFVNRITTLVLSLLALTLVIQPGPANSEVAQAGHATQNVRMSGSSICHCRGGAYFQRVSPERSFDTLASCLAAGGREPKQGQGDCPEWSASGPSRRSSVKPRDSYQRSYFGPWADEDGNCLNTRHELLVRLSTSPVSMTDGGCSVQRGKWYDPYTNQNLSDAADVDIDHLVPLAYAWRRGADRWSAEKRLRFANDPANLIPVSAEANRRKGAKGPLDWMPEAAGFHCQYLLRFTRVSKTYQLRTLPAETAAIDAMRREACSRQPGA